MYVRCGDFRKHDCLSGRASHELLLRKRWCALRLDSGCSLLDKPRGFPRHFRSCTACGSSLFRGFHHRVLPMPTLWARWRFANGGKRFSLRAVAQHHCRRNLRLGNFLPAGTRRSCSYRRTAETDALASAAEDPIRGYCTAFNHSYVRNWRNTKLKMLTTMAWITASGRFSAWIKNEKRDYIFPKRTFKEMERNNED